MVGPELVPPPLLRSITGNRHTSFVASPNSSAKIPQYSTLTTPTAQPLPNANQTDGAANVTVKPGFTGTVREDEALAALVKTVLGDTWAHVQLCDIKVEDKSGEGGSATYRITAKRAVPETVALHGRSEDVVADPLSEPRTEAAAQLFATNKLGPRRLAQGGDWFIEPWVGSGRPTFHTEEKFWELGQPVAKIHMLPTDWYDEWREKLCEAMPALREVP